MNVLSTGSGLLMVVLASVPLASGQPLPHPTPGRYIVVLKEGVVAEEVTEAHGLKPHRIYGTALKGFASELSQGRLFALQHDNRVDFLEVDQKVYALGQVVPTGVRRVGATLSSVARINGVDERVNADVAVLDTGIDLAHPDLQVVNAVSFSADNTTGDDGHGHGTHVAGIVGALVTAKGFGATLTGSTDASGQAAFLYTINAKRGGYGVSTVRASVSKSGFYSGSASTTYTVGK